MRNHQNTGDRVEQTAHQIDEEAAPSASREPVNYLEYAGEDQ
jgi:hypothetical protein